MDYLSQLALDEFLHLVFLPCLQPLIGAGSKSNVDYLYSRAAVFESLELLRLGVEVGASTRSSADALLRQYVLVLREQCSLYPPEMNHVLGSERLMAIRQMIELVQVKTIFDFSEGARLATTFQVLIDLVARANADPMARAYWTAFLYVTDARWQVFLDRGINGDEVMAALKGDCDLWVDGNRPSIYAGFFRVIQHMEDTLEALDYKHRRCSVPDWVQFRQAFKDIHGWRHNDQKNGIVAERMQCLIERLAAVMREEFAAANGSIDAHMLKAYAQDLYDRWGGLARPAVREATC